MFRRRVKSIGIAEVLTTPRSPWKNPFAERVIGTIRRELLDHVSRHQHGSKRRPHHRKRADLPRHDRLMRAAKSLDQDVLPKVESLCIAGWRAAIELLAAPCYELGQCPRGKEARHFTSLVASQSIGDRVEPQRRQRAGGILIVFAATRVGGHSVLDSNHRTPHLLTPNFER